MKIVVDARFFGPAGTGLGKYTEKLLENLEKLDTKNQYFVLLQKDNFNLFKPRAKNFTKVLANVHWYSLEEQIKIPQILSKIKPGLVHFCHFNIPVFYKRKFVVTIHDLIKHEFAGAASTTRFLPLYFLKHQVYKFVISNAVKKSVKILVPSNWVKKRILEDFAVSKDKIVVTHEAADEIFKIQAQSNKRQDILKKYRIEQPFLIYVGNLYPYKNLEIVLRAFRTLEKRIPALKFLIASSHDVFHQRFFQLVKTYKLEKKVGMPGFIPTQDLVSLYRQASAYVFPSLSEGFGIPGLDAASSGLPVVASDIPVFREVYGNAVLYFNPKSHADLADKITRIIEDNRLRQDLIEKGRKQAAKYSWQKMAQETLKVYLSYNLD